MVVKNIISGGKSVLNLTKELLTDKENKNVGYPSTNYNLPIIYGLLGKKLKILSS
ncbi:bifunctional acetyl-CoA decarbonylase/synthase complex subunit alpha/beta [Methanothermococcus okinawensis IH1]|uniref:Bifunctional acetyl-CoA decarbonylase/synthase complex subunit alpha/beta n=1 Tax=Methanothermococcus okinawensis (strain DSM 14208 / JCM 11175 / IH1) TaxID=647113 RepID=F8AM36_METOI|nr:bifunctional acetyl-CoA decarbonylase/synthase complex subunit alpha/beta [Methanothermococcus okinawensis]AEH06721.1 bifunctional acetyl-CoA decarbonylase/synthase complex subunit alpha/beta [Methanothermococcus okinawensis IH1]